MRFWAVLLTAVVGTQLVGRVDAAITTLTFESVAYDGLGPEYHQLGPTYNEAGFQLTNSILGDGWAAFGVVGTGDTRYTGSTSLFGLYYNSVVGLSSISGSPFDLLSIGLAPLVGNYPGPSKPPGADGPWFGPITFIGYLANGQTVSESITLAVQSNYYELQTFHLPAFRDVTQVTWGPGWSPQFGHIVIETDDTPTVPEPSTIIIWSLLGTLAIGLGWRRKRKVA